MPSCFHLSFFGPDHGVPLPVPSVVEGLIEGLMELDAMGVALGVGTTVTIAVATGAMVAVRVGAMVAMGFTLARQVQPLIRPTAVSTVPSKIRILFRFKGHTSFFQVMPLFCSRGNENIHTRLCQFFGFQQHSFPRLARTRSSSFLGSSRFSRNRATRSANPSGR